MSGRSPNKLEGNDDHAKLQDLCTRTYKEQTVWFMNAFWEDVVKAQAERFWDYKHKMDELDLQNHEMGTGLDEMKAHVFLEHFKETQTVREMRTNLRESGAIGETERPKVVPMIHFLLFRYKVNWHELVNAPQGDNSEEIAECARLLQAAQDACKEAERTATAAASALREAIAAEADARAREDQAKADAAQAAKDEAKAQADEADAKAREAKAKADAEAAAQREAKAHADAEAAKAREAEAEAAQNELEAALAEVKAQEDAYNAKTEDLKQKSETGGVVSRNKAKNELAQHLGEDPLPLRRAKITQEAAVKKADKTRQAAAEARASAEASAAAASEARQAADASARQAEAARKAAEASARQAEAARRAADESARQAEAARVQAQQARQRSEEAKARADAALQDARAKMAEAEAALQVAKEKPGTSFGAIWWMERELVEARKYMPESKGGIRRNK